MDVVLWNRVADPTRFGAKKDATLTDIVKARGQFAGFESYPNYAQSIVNRIQDMINIANNPKDQRSADFTAHINAALSVASSPSIADPSGGKLVAWRTAGSGSPGTGFRKHATVLGIDFYFQ